MSKRAHEFDASATAENRIKCLKSTSNDEMQLRHSAGNRDGASTATALATPPNSTRCASTNFPKLKIIPKETLLDILARLRRRDLDALELVNRALGSLISAKSDDAPRRVISMMFYEEGIVMLTCPSDGWRRVPVVELPHYLPQSVITKVIFKPGCYQPLTDEMFQALRSCGAHFAAGSMCDFRLLYAFPPSILYRALTEVFMCTTFVFAKLYAFFDHRHYGDEQSLPALPCIANCASLQIDEYHEALFDANGALDWLLGTHAAAPGVKHLASVQKAVFECFNAKRLILERFEAKRLMEPDVQKAVFERQHLSVGEVGSGYWDDFLVPFIVAIEQQFIQATTPTSFKVDLLFFVGNSPAPDVGTTRELENVDTNEQLEVNVDTDVRKPNGEPALKTRVTIRRKATA